MSPDATEITEAQPASAAALVARLTAEARRLDPVRVHFLETLAQRIEGAPEASRPLLARKLELAFASLQADMARAQEASGVNRQAAAEQPAHTALRPLQALTRYLAEQTNSPSPERPAHDPAPRTELRAVRQFRSTWSKLSTQKQLHNALEQAPKNAGPINSHSLVLRSLALMRDISPDYLSRFMTYADTLLCLDEASQSKAEPAKSGATPVGAKKPRARRAR